MPEEPTKDQLKDAITTKVDIASLPLPVTVESVKETPAEERSIARAQIAEEEETIVRTQGQRKINLIWEITQAALTVLITAAIIWTEANNIDSEIMKYAFVAVITTYYNRTNHTRIGGVIKDQTGR